MPRSAVRLRQVRHGDIPAIHAWLKDPTFHGDFLFGWFGAEDDFTAMKKKLDVFLKQGQARRFLAVERTSDNMLVGLVLLQKGRRADCRYMGAYVETSSRGKGFGSEAMSQLVDYIFKTEKSVDRIEAATSTMNIPSQKALEKIGFRSEGIKRKTTFRDGHWEDSVLYALAKGEFRRS